MNGEILLRALAVRAGRGALVAALLLTIAWALAAGFRRRSEEG